MIYTRKTLNNLVKAGDLATLANKALIEANGLLADIVDVDDTLSDVINKFSKLIDSQEFNPIAELSDFAKATQENTNNHVAEFKNSGIYAICTKQMFALNDEVARKQLVLKDKLDYYENRRENLKKAGLDGEELEKIHPFPKEEIDSERKLIECIQEEIKSLGKLLSDWPIYETGSLVGGIVQKLAEFNMGRKAA